MSDKTLKPWVEVYVEGTILILEDHIDQVGVIQAVQESLGHTGFTVLFAEEN